jgi:hemolysin III
MVVHSWGKAVACFFGIAVSGRFLATFLVADHALRISFWYISMALPIVLPLFVVVQRKARSEKILFIGVLASFAVAVIFRMWDRTGVEPLLPMGTHFLWHLFGGVAVFLLMLLQVRIVEQASSLRE